MYIDELDKYVDNKLIKVSSHQWRPELQIACYTKTCFFGKDTWDSVTTQNRGTLFYRNYQVNKPFNKIFNLGEVEDTNVESVIERMKFDNWKVLDKVNGHLFIVSIFPTDEGMQYAYSTKGSLPNDQNDLLCDDIKIFEEKYGDRLRDIVEFQQEFLDDGWELCGRTLMFESVCEHDKHTLWDKEVETYGANDFVLLGVTETKHDLDTYEVIDHIDSDPDDLEIHSGLLGHCPTVKIITEGVDRPIEDWFKDKGTEGYVIRFDNGDRVKVKTTEYWRMRFKKDLTPERVFQTFATKGLEGLRDKLPEEISDSVIDAVLKDYSSWFILERAKLLDLDDYIGFMTRAHGRDWLNAKSIFTDDVLDDHIKHIAKAIYIDEKHVDDVINTSVSNKTNRRLFNDAVDTRRFGANLDRVYNNVIRDF